VVTNFIAMQLILSVILWFALLNFDNSSAWKRHTIDNSSSGADGAKLADINADGLPDIVTGWEEGGLTNCT